MSKPALILENVLAHEKNRPDFVYMRQPTGNGQVIDYTWRETLKQARSMAAYIKAQNLGPGAKVAILSKNCAHFIMAELAIWMSGCTTVAIFPTELGETVRYVLDHSQVVVCRKIGHMARTSAFCAGLFALHCIPLGACQPICKVG
jgi:long-subunit acyl-CoA synthetase (AMP-forming)